MIRRTMLATLLCALVGAGSIAHAEDYPSRPIKLVVPFPAGGGVDALGRALGEQLSLKFKQPVVVENRPGASGNIGADYAYKAAPDGYTFFLAGEGPMAVNRLLMKQISFDPDKFEPVAMLTYVPMMIVVNAKTPIHNLQELIDYGKANPDKLAYSSAGRGGPSHLAAEVFQSRTGAHYLHVPYKGIAPAFNDLAAGHVDMMFGFEASVAPYFGKDDEIRILAVTSEQRHPALPDVPTVSESLPGFAPVSWTSLVAPPGTPADVIKTVSDATIEAMHTPGMQKLMKAQGYQILGTGPAEARAYIQKAAKGAREAVKIANIQPE